MKLRIKDNAIRIRLAMSEVARLAAGASLHQQTTFGPAQKLIYSIQGSNRSALSVTFNGSEIALHVPQTQLDQWAASDDVAISSRQMVDDETALQILVEKDFECLHPGHPVEPDAYPHPERLRQAR
jgi:hypothetical protein